MGKEEKAEWEEIREEDKPWETLDSGKQTEGCGKGLGRGHGVTGWWALRRTCDVMNTGCYTQPMNHWTLHQKLVMCCILANWI